MKLPLPFLLGCALTVALSSLPNRAWADEPEPVHRFVDDRQPPPAARGKVLLAGTLITGAFYLPVLGASYAWPDQRGASDLRIPVVGPWMTLSQTRLCNADPVATQDCSDFLRVAGAVLLAFDGLGQAGGVGVLLQALLMRTEARPTEESSRYRTELSSLTNTPRTASHPLIFRSGDFEMTPVPMVGARSDLGLAFVGRF